MVRIKEWQFYSLRVSKSVLGPCQVKFYCWSFEIRIGAVDLLIEEINFVYFIKYIND